MQKQITCNFDIAYSGGQLDSSGCSVSCSLKKNVKKVIDKSYEFDFTVGDLRDMLSVKVSFRLSKSKNGGAGSMKTLDKTFTASSIDAGEASYPSDLWCPQEDTLIYTASNSVVNEVNISIARLALDKNKPWTSCLLSSCHSSIRSHTVGA